MKEMEAKELRVGNIVRYADSVYLDGGKVTEVGDIIQYETDYYEQIPLTEEWLLKFGAEKQCDDLFDFENYKFGYFYFKNNELYSVFQSQQLCEPIKYVHQLQNLYFALTGTELKYNERK
jgi:hypothetical protein